MYYCYIYVFFLYIYLYLTLFFKHRMSCTQKYSSLNQIFTQISHVWQDGSLVRLLDWSWVVEVPEELHMWA